MPTWKDAIAIAKTLPKVEVGTVVRNARPQGRRQRVRATQDRSQGGLVLMCSLDEKERLLESGDAIDSTPHYDGYGSIIVNLAKVGPDALLAS